MRKYTYHYDRADEIEERDTMIGVVVLIIWLIIGIIFTAMMID